MFFQSGTETGHTKDAIPENKELCAVLETRDDPCGFGATSAMLEKKEILRNFSGAIGIKRGGKLRNGHNKHVESQETLLTVYNVYSALPALDMSIARPLVANDGAKKLDILHLIAKEIEVAKEIFELITFPNVLALEQGNVDLVEVSYDVSE